MAGPCPCMPLQRGTSILAIIDIVLNALLLVLLIIGFVAIATLSDAELKDQGITKSEKAVALTFVAFSILICICAICLAVYLRRSALDNNYTGLSRWLIISIVLFIISFINVIVSNTQASNGTNIASGVLGLLYRIYEMIVVYCFMKELSSIGGGGMGPAPAYNGGGV